MNCSTLVLHPIDSAKDLKNFGMQFVLEGENEVTIRYDRKMKAWCVGLYIGGKCTYFKVERTYKQAKKIVGDFVRLALSN